jgi:transposase
VAAIGGVGLQTVRDWVLRVDARGPDGRLDGKAPGQPSILSDERRKRLSGVTETGPILAVRGVVRWRLADLMRFVWYGYQSNFSKQTISREVRALDFRELSVWRRHHAKSEAAVAAFKKISHLRDQSGWRVSRKLTLSSNITLVQLPAKAPELNPVKNILQFMRENWI